MSPTICMVKSMGTVMFQGQDWCQTNSKCQEHCPGHTVGVRDIVQVIQSVSVDYRYVLGLGLNLDKQQVSETLSRSYSQCQEHCPGHTCFQNRLPLCSRVRMRARVRKVSEPSTDCREALSYFVRCRHGYERSTDCQEVVRHFVRCRHGFEPSTDCQQALEPSTDSQKALGRFNRS